MRQEFPATQQKINGKDLVYLDSAATTLKPISVIEEINKFNKFETANVHRGAHWLSDQATVKFEESRKRIANFMGADADEVIFTSGTTDGINLLAHCLSDKLSEGDEVLLTEMEHHSNLVPWHLIKEKKNIKLKFIPVDENGELDLTNLTSLITEKTKVASFVHMSNALGTINPIEKIIHACKASNVLTIIDAAQSISCTPINVKKLNCDFLVWSGHKFFGPYGTGVLYGRKQELESLRPYRGGGSMIENVELENSTYLGAPQKFEAGTPNISGVIGLGAAVKTVESWGFDKIISHEDGLTNQLIEAVASIEGTHLIGKSKSRRNIVSFTADWGHPSDIGQLLDQQGIAVRTGHHCTQPLMKKFGISGTIRASLSVYNNNEDINRLLEAMTKARKMLL